MPLVPVNCGALPETLIESELFGHRKGAFTGADEHRTGLLQVANGGSLFLDEIGELPKAMQAKLLRFLESGEVRRVGDNESFICDVRVICATNRDLAEMVAAGEFPRGPLVPHQHVRDSAAAAARAGRRHSAPGPAPGDPLRRAAGSDDAIFAPETLRDAHGPRLAGQRPRAGQRDRARDDPLRRVADPAGALCRGDFSPSLPQHERQNYSLQTAERLPVNSASFSHAPLRVVEPAATSRCKRSTPPSTATPATSRKPPKISASA